MSELKLAFELTFEQLYATAGLKNIDEIFLKELEQTDADLCHQLRIARGSGATLDKKQNSDLLLALAPHLNRFLAKLFNIETASEQLSKQHHDLDYLYQCKRLFVQRRAGKAYKKVDVETFDATELTTSMCLALGEEVVQIEQQLFARMVNAWLSDKDNNVEKLQLAEKYAAWALWSETGQKTHRADILFKQPSKIDLENLVDIRTIEEDDVSKIIAPEDEYLQRDGFNLTDKGADLVEALDQSNYCVICHDRNKDSCSIGIRNKQDGKFAQNGLGVTMAGCPLEEKISEMHKAKNDGLALAALAIITTDNPMVAATGHRICNDCMKACIYQKQTAVNIPQVETRTLKDVLNLPYGFEIYSLLTRWNPLNFQRPFPLDDSGYKVLVVGLGPAGFSLAHFLMNQGHSVVGIDGLKIEPLDAQTSGVTQSGTRVAFEPIKNINSIVEALDDRVQAGFGGVAEYGITVRWDKNFLKIIRLLLERRANFNMLGGIRFGSAITAESAYQLGFDHVALCMGAGKPTVLNIPNGLARGVRQASDFLMALQLTGSAKKDSVANLQVRLPAIVIGGGLTAIDTATEVLTYYVRQVEKFLQRYEILVVEQGEQQVRSFWTAEETIIADEFIAHGRAIKNEKSAALNENRQHKVVELLNQWGGATLAYRRKMTASPSYQLNNEEIEKALEQGIRFAELLSPVAVAVDQYEHVSGLKLARQRINEQGRPEATDEIITLPARSVLIAAGTQPNTVLSREHPGFSDLDGKYFQAYDENGHTVNPEWSTKPDQVNVLMEEKHGGTMSFFGDLHPSYAGNVVKAIASAKQGYPVVDRVLRRREASAILPQQLFENLNDGLRATVHDVLRLTPNIIEVVLRAPLVAKAFQPGQFFRLQNYAANSTRVADTTLATEGMALTGAWVDRDKGLISTIVMEMGGSSSLCKLLKKDEHVVLMGPTGAPTEVPDNPETVLLLGGGLGNAVLFSIGQAMRQAGSKVLYFAAYKGINDRYHIENIEKASDQIVWCCDTAPGFTPDREQDKAFVGNVVQAMDAYGKGELGEVDIPLMTVDRIIAIGSDMMMNAVKESRHGILKTYFKAGHLAYGSINSPMQCMMKEICAQCIQSHKDPDTGEETVVYSCCNQDQPLDRVNFPSLRQRLCQNAVHEKLTKQWIARSIEGLEAI